jgi:hypothetical protein
MSSTNKTSLGLNMWEASDKPVRQDFVYDNVIIDEKITKLNSDLTMLNSKLILNQDCKYLASKQIAALNTGGNTWMHIRLADLGITGKKLPDYCAPIACLSWYGIGSDFRILYCHRYDDTTIQIGFNAVATFSFRISLLFGLTDA